MMYKKILNSLLNSFLFVSVILLVGCGGGCATFSHGSDFPKDTIQSFAKIEKTLRIDLCEGENCRIDAGTITGSGVVVKVTPLGGYVLTAGHVCDTSSDIVPKMKLIRNIDIRIEILDIDYKRWYAEIVEVHKGIDTCILWVPDLDKPAVRISFKDPEQGDKAYNVAAPAGIFYDSAVPLLEGYYMGERKWDGVAMYTVPAAGGSSGSPIFNSRGHLIGMIHSVNRYFPFVSISPTSEQLRRFIFSSIKRHQTSK